MVLRTLFCSLQNVRRAICTRSLTNKFVASLHLIIWTVGFLQIEPPHLLKQILLASFTSTDVVLRTLFCFSQNARRAICTHSLTSELVDSRRLIIVLDRLEALGFVFSRDVNARFRCDFGIAMTEVLVKFRVVNLLRKRYDFAYGKSYGMLRIVMI